MPNTIPPVSEVPEGRWAIVVSDYNGTITQRLLEGAIDTLLGSGVDDDQIEIVRVPGAWELPMACSMLADTDRFLAIIALGCVIKGETPHDEYINASVSKYLMEISLDTATYVAFGLLTCLNLEQAVQRAGGRVGNKGVEAAETALAMVRQFDGISLWDENCG